MKKDGKINNFYKLKKIEKRKNNFCEICSKKVRSKIDQQQKGPQKNGPRQSGLAKKT